MSNSHKDAPLGQRHPIHDIEKVNQADRTSAVYQARDVDRVVKQLDDGSYWVISAVDGSGAATFNGFGNGAVLWGDIADIPTTLAGYGISEATVAAISATVFPTNLISRQTIIPPDTSHVVVDYLRNTAVLINNGIIRVL